MAGNIIHHSFGETLVFLTQSILIFFAPGAVLSRLLRLDLKNGERFCFSWVSGYLIATFFYFVCVRLQIEKLFLPGIGIANLYYWIFLLKKDVQDLRSGWHPTRWWYVYGVWALLMSALIWVQADRWCSLGANGLRLAEDLYSDNLWGTAIAAGMKYRIPPENPVLAGEKLLYHYFPYLTLTFFSKLFSMSLLSLSFFYLQILSRLLFFGSLLCLVRRIFINPRARFFAMIITVFLGSSDFKIGFAIGFAYFFWGLIFYSHYLESGRKHAIALCSILWGALISSLTVLGFIVYETVLLMPIFTWLRSKSKARSSIVIACAVILSAFIWLSLSFGFPTHDDKPAVVKLGFGIQKTLHESIESFSPDLYEFWRTQRRQPPKKFWDVLSGELKPMRYVFIVTIWILSLAALLIQRLDFAIFGFWEALKSLFRKDPGSKNYGLNFLAAAGVIGVLSTFILKWYEQDVVSNYFVMSYVLLLLFSAAFIPTIFQSPGKFIYKFLIALLLLHSLSFRALKRIPGLWQPYRYYTETPVEWLNAYNFLKTNVEPQDLILHSLIDETIYSNRPDEKPWIYDHHNYNFPILTERQSLFIVPHRTQDITKNRLPGSYLEREEDIKNFFSTKDEHVGLSILEKYGVHWIVTTSDKPIQFRLGDRLKLAYQNNRIKIFRYR